MAKADDVTFGMAVEDDGEGPPVLRLRGELDLGNAETAASAIGDLLAANRGVVVDLGELTFVDSTGLGAFIRGRNIANRSQQHITLRSPPRSVLKVLQITGLDQVFTIEP